MVGGQHDVHAGMPVPPPFGSVLAERAAEIILLDGFILASVRGLFRGPYMLAQNP